MPRPAPGRHGHNTRLPDLAILRWLSTGTAAANATGLLLIGVAVSLAFALLFTLLQWPVLGQPTQVAHVSSITATGGERSCGKSCTCDDADIRMVIDDGGPDGVEHDCLDYYAVGERVDLRRHRDDPTEVYVDPIPGQWLIPAGALAALGLGATLGLVVAAQAAWETLVSRRARRRRTRRQ